MEENIQEEKKKKKRKKNIQRHKHFQFEKFLLAQISTFFVDGESEFLILHVQQYSFCNWHACSLIRSARVTFLNFVENLLKLVKSTQTLTKYSTNDFRRISKIMTFQDYFDLCQLSHPHKNVTLIS